MTTQDTGTSHRASTADPVLPSATTLAKGLAVLRIFFGIVLFANGIAKLFEFRRIEVGPYIANLIDKGSAGWALTFTELVVGGMLILGAATRLAALIGLGQALFLALVFATRNRWAFEAPHEYVPLIILAIIPAGRVWGLDGRLLRLRRTSPGELRGWPF